MAITMQQVLMRLDTDEPDYAALSSLGPEAMPHLAVLVRGEDPGIAAKAAYLASLIESDETSEVMAAAAASPHETVRVAAAAGLRNLAPAQAAPTAERLLDDRDAGVRKQALKAVAELGMGGLEVKVRQLSADDPEEGLRDLAKEGLRRISEIRAELAEEVTQEEKPAKPKPAKRAPRRPSTRGKK